MAMGFGSLLGFKVMNNFNLPYFAHNPQEFWRRWHISLSTWFRDYLYIPLGGNRGGLGGTIKNLIIVMLLCGLWHGASWVFVTWGLYHGFFLVLERSPAGRLLNKMPVPIQHIYTVVVIMIGWVFFRSDTLGQALLYVGALVNFSGAPYLDAKLFAAMNNEFFLALAFGSLFAMPVIPVLKMRLDKRLDNMTGSGALFLRSSTAGILMIWMVSLIIYSSAELISGSHNPFLYFRF